MNPDEAPRVTAPVPADEAPPPPPDPSAPVPGAEAPPAPREPMLYDLLILGPNVGEDADFERPRRPRRDQA